MVERIHTVVVGAGVIGLAIARRLARDAGELLILEREQVIGSGTSSRSSEVVHAGMYYAAGTRKARSCVEGRRMLYDYCRDRGVAHRRVGKLIVATGTAQLEQLQGIAERSRINGLNTAEDALQWLDAAAVQAMEPDLQCVAALWSPATGIVDTHGLMLAYQGDAEQDGAVLCARTDFVSARRDGDGWRVLTSGADGEFEIACTHLVNAAGLQAQHVAARIEGLDPRHVPGALWLKGNYFTVSGPRPPFRYLIYPVPSGGGLGVHLTLDLGGQARFGPDTEELDPSQARDDMPDYAVNAHRAAVFYAAIRDYWPGLPDGSLQPAYAGIRPKLASGGNEPGINDFEISGPTHHGLPGLVQLYGIESPGITASLALAEEVARTLEAV